MLDLEVVPEEGLQSEQWEFLLGMHFSQAVSLVQALVRSIRTAHVVYNENSPLENDLVLDLPQDGFRLMFDSKSQRLKLIEVYNLKLVRLKYCGSVFNGPELVPSVEQIDKAFGATRPGSYDKQRGLFALNFRGLTFYFPVDIQYQPHYNHGLGSLRFPGDASPILSKMLVYSGTNPSEPPVPPIPLSCFKNHIYIEECNVLRNSSCNRSIGLSLTLTTPNLDILDSRPVTFTKKIYFGEDVQSIVSKLGTPSRVFYKCDDKMKIHSKEPHKKVISTSSDYFFNYFTMGMDILFDSQNHTAIKFILHTNFPGNYDFNSYHRCPFSLQICRQIPQSIVPSSIDVTSSENTRNNGGNGKSNGKSPKVKKNKQNSVEQQPAILPASTTTIPTSRSSEKTWITIGYDTHWEEVNEFVSSSSTERPVVLTRSSSNNPFGSSLCYGVQDLIFEVLSNDHIASVTIYKVED